MRGHFAWEFKGKHAVLSQLNDYADALENPPLLVVSDIDSIVVRTNFTNTPTQKHIIPLAELGQPKNPRYTPTTCFETFPFPWPPGTEPVDDPRVIAIAEAAKELDEKRRAWLDPPGASDADLKKRTLTNLYNERATCTHNWTARFGMRTDGRRTRCQVRLRKS